MKPSQVVKHGHGAYLVVGRYSNREYRAYAGDCRRCDGAQHFLVIANDQLGRAYGVYDRATFDDVFVVVREPSTLEAA